MKVWRSATYAAQRLQKAFSVNILKVISCSTGRKNSKVQDQDGCVMFSVNCITVDELNMFFGDAHHAELRKAFSQQLFRNHPGGANIPFMSLIMRYCRYRFLPSLHSKTIYFCNRLQFKCFSWLNCLLCVDKTLAHPFSLVPFLCLDQRSVLSGLTNKKMFLLKCLGPAMFKEKLFLQENLKI